VANKNHTIDKTTFLVNETRHSIELATAFLFTPEVCHTNQFKVINRFTRQQKEWENLNLFVEKYSNFHGCALEFDYKTAFYAKLSNFPFKEVDGEVFLNKTISFSFDFLTDTTLQSFNTYVTDIESRKLFVPPGGLYSDFEKMLLPFDSSTWIAIIVTIVVSISTILTIKLKHALIQNVIFGRNNRSPLVNFFSILINGGQHTKIVENVPRILFMTLIFWSLIFR
jgi:hypothetical protein